jgi:GNAT superfamily N-acetyltransferase
MTAPTAHERLEQAMCDLFWIPGDVTVVDRPDLLLLRCERPIQMLNTVLRAVVSPDRADALVQEVRTLHANTASRWSVPDTRPSAHLEAALARGGYVAGHEHEARGIEVAAFRPRPSSDFVVRPIDSVDRMRHSIAATNEAFGRSDAFGNEELARDVALCTGLGARVHRFVAYDVADAPVASASMTSFPALRFGFLWGGGTIPGARGRGAYSALLASRLAVARELGLSHVGLYARVATSAPIVTRCGFEHWGSMTYWERSR